MQSSRSVLVAVLLCATVSAANAQSTNKPATKRAAPKPAEAAPKPKPITVSNYLPIRPGAKWQYRVDFPDDTELLYYPEFERPKGLVTASGITGSGSWKKGSSEFGITVQDSVESSATSSTWKLDLSDAGHKFFFYIEMKDPVKSRVQHQIRLKPDKDATLLDLLFIFGEKEDPPPFQLARLLARLAPSDLEQKSDVTVPAGTFKNCVKSVIDVNEFSTDFRHAARKQQVETLLGPNVGIVKAVGKDSSGKVLYTLELTQFTPGTP